MTYSFQTERVLRFNYGDPARAIEAMRKSARLNFAARNGRPVCRSRVKSAIKVIRELQLLLNNAAS